MARHKPMSMEAVLDQERREVLALLEGQSPARPKTSNTGTQDARSSSPYKSPRSFMRSMLDVGDGVDFQLRESDSSKKSSAKRSPPPTAPVRSMLDLSSPPLAPVRSMLDIDSPSTATGASRNISNNTSSLAESNSHSHAFNSTHPRSLSDATIRPVDFGPTSTLDPTADYQFSGIITHTTGTVLPKRVTQGGKRPSASPAMVEVMRGSDLTSMVLPVDRGRHYSTAGAATRGRTKSKSPHNRFGVRSLSPHNNLLSGRALSPGARSLIADTQALDFQQAYKRLNDANFARSSGSLRELSDRRKKPDDGIGSGRLTKDYLGPDGEPLEDSSDDRGDSSSDDEGERGRKPSRMSEASAGNKNSKKSEPSISPETKRKALSLLAAAEEERIEVAARQPKHKYKSLFDDSEITIASSYGERVKTCKASVHPATSFDNPPWTRSVTPVNSDTEADLTDIKRAQKLSFATTQITSIPETCRTIQIVTRGEYTRIALEAEDEQRTLRKYLVATDLSDESTHALEWAVGTVLRDGDTLICIYCVDEETGIAGGETVSVSDDQKAMKEQAAVIHAMSSTKAPLSPGGSVVAGQTYRPSPLMRAFDTNSLPVSPSPAAMERSKTAEERHRAVKDISDRVTRLLRKTRLQVRVIVEVIHCKNPKHLITEVIDVVNPTLIILGSRGRSALKGVILGSFSNYLVNKSSVPVMVARKRLRKQTKFRRLPASHQVNNINNPAARSLSNAEID